MKRLGLDFWNIRGSFKLFGLIEIGTHMSIVKKQDGRFLILDSCELTDEDKRLLLTLTSGGTAVDAILNVHPFHTLHCRTIQALFPHARLYGTQRHHDRQPDLPWQKGPIEDAAIQAEFSEDLDFTVPAGVDLISTDEKVHVGSIMVRHGASGIVHVDDTLNVFRLPGLLGLLAGKPKLRFHPMLAKGLDQRAGAADDFIRWANDLAIQWSGTPIIATAHSMVRDLPDDGWTSEIKAALAAATKALDAHRAKFG